MIYAIDFDGTLCVSEYPEIGPPIYETIEYVKNLKKKGNKIILWTCRNGKFLEDAVEWCNIHGITFDAANENLPEVIEFYGGDTRKITADFYVDDKNVILEWLSEKQFATNTSD